MGCRGAGSVLACALAVASAGCGGGAPAAAKAPRPPPVAALIAKLRARDAQIRTAHLPFRWSEVGAGGAAPVHHTGWWAKDAGRTAELSAYGDRSVFDGATLAVIDRFGGTRFGDLGDAYIPTDLYDSRAWGLGTHVSSWAALLEWSPRVQVLGRETVAGRDCLRVAVDMPTGAAPGVGTADAALVWFDDLGSGLAMRYEELLPSGAMPGLTPAQEAAFAVDLGDRPRFVFTRLEIAETRTLDGGIEIASEVVYALPAFASQHITTVRLADGAWLNRAVDPAWFAVPPRPLTPRQRTWLTVGAAALAGLVLLLGWALWFRRHRRRDAAWPGGDDPESLRARAVVRRLAWLAVPVALGDLGQKLFVAVPLTSRMLTPFAGYSLPIRAAITSTLVVGTALLLISALRLDAALRGEPARAPAAFVLAALAGLVGGLPWVALVGAHAATTIATGLGPGAKWDDWVLLGGAVLLQLPLVAVGILAAAWYPRVARATGRVQLET